MNYYSYCVLLLLVSLPENFSVGKKIPRIGIIGAGIGGTSCAYFLRQLFGTKEIIIDLFEAETLGGRLSIVNFANDFYEEGGSIIHSKNQYMVSFLKEFNLHKRHSPEGHLALYDGKKIIFTESEWKFITLWNMIYRYGFGFLKLKHYINDLLRKFERIYELQSVGETYATVGSLLAAIDPKFVMYLNESTRKGFKSYGISDRVIDEIVMATIRANYGQNLNISKMVGSVSVAGAVGNLWAVKGGNVKIPENLLKASKANLIKLPVKSIKKLDSGKLLISAKKGSNNVKAVMRKYDVVVLAAPQTLDSKFRIRLINFPKDIRFPGRYHKTVCTLIEGRLAADYFPNKNHLVDEILTTKEDILFNSVGRVFSVYDVPEKSKKSTVWKVFTQEKLNQKQIFSLFSEVKSFYVKEWLAYPHYDSSFRNDSFILASNFYFVNAIEWAASAMEMSAIGAKNIALLIYKKLGTGQNNPNKISNSASKVTHIIRQSKKEL